MGRKKAEARTPPVDLAVVETPTRGPRDARTEIERLAHLNMIQKLHLRGWNNRQIAEKLGLSEATVSRDLRDIRRMLKQVVLNDAAADLAREIAKLDALEMELWDAWEASKTTKVTRSKKVTQGDGEQPGRAVATVREEQSHGDPAYLKEVRQTIQLRTELKGYKAVGGNNVLAAFFGGQQGDARDMSDAELENVAAGGSNRIVVAPPRAPSAD